MNTEKIEVGKIHLDPAQPREVYHGIEELAESMKNAGFQEDQAISVWRPDGIPAGEYQVIDGHRRTKAAKLANLAEIPCYVFEGIAPREVWEKQLIANANREDLSPMNRARSFHRSIEEMGMSIGRVAKIHGITVATIKADLELIGLAELLHPFVDDGSLSKEVARKLATSFTSPGQQVHVFNNHLKGKKTATAMLTAIEAYLAKQNQMDIFSQAEKEAGENGGLKKARKASEKLQKTVIAFEKNWLGDPNVVNARKRDIRELKQVAVSMDKIAAKLLEQIGAFEARKEMNAPATAGA